MNATVQDQRVENDGTVKIGDDGSTKAFSIGTIFVNRFGTTKITLQRANVQKGDKVTISLDEDAAEDLIERIEAGLKDVRKRRMEELQEAVSKLQIWIMRGPMS